MSPFRVILKGLQLAFCTAALIIKKLADSHAGRVLKFKEKFSNEWRLLNSLNWTQEGSEFATFLFGGFIFISGICLISSFWTTAMETCERIMISIGALMFLLEGCLILASVEDVPEEITFYGYLLGSVCGFIAILFIIDVCVNKMQDKQTMNHLLESSTLKANLKVTPASQHCYCYKKNFVTEV